MKLMQMDESFLNRGVNEGFSGGEKKRNEILQMAVLEPKLAHARRDRLGPRHRRAAGRRRTASTACARRTRAIVLVTHYQRLLDYIEPDFVHVLSDGRILRTGGQVARARARAARLRLGASRRRAPHERRPAPPAVAALPRRVRSACARRWRGATRPARAPRIARASPSSAFRRRARKPGSTRACAASKRAGSRRCGRDQPRTPTPCRRRCRRTASCCVNGAASQPLPPAWPGFDVAVAPARGGRRRTAATAGRAAAPNASPRSMPRSTQARCCCRWPRGGRATTSCS